jgi:hypothetical protein
MVVENIEQPKTTTRVVQAEFPGDKPPDGKVPGRRRGRPPKNRADETIVRKVLYTTFSTSNFALNLTGQQRYQLTAHEIDTLTNVWTQVAMNYPTLLDWMGRGGVLSDWAQAFIITVSIYFPKLTGVDLNKPVNLNGSVDTSFAGRVNIEQPSHVRGNQNGEIPEDQSGGTRFDGWDNGIRQDNPSQIFVDS